MQYMLLHAVDEERQWDDQETDEVQTTLNV
jgi:hypothetical protein